MKNLTTSIPHYTDLAIGGMDLDSLPFVAKRQIQDSISEFMNANFKFEELIHRRTSGSTGTMLDVYWSQEDMLASLAPLWRQRSQLGVSVKDRHCSFHSSLVGNTVSYPDFIEDERELSFNRLFFDENRLTRYYEALRDFGPVWFDASPTSLYLFAKFIQRKGLEAPPTLRYIELSGEMAHKEHVDFIESTFRSTVRLQYGSREANAIAFQCSYGQLHLLDNVYLELRDADDTGIGDLAVTVLANRAMAFARYEIGDRGRLLEGRHCECQSSATIVELSGARKTDYFEFQGRLHYSSIFLEAVEAVNRIYLGAIMQFQVLFDGSKFFVRISTGQTLVPQNVVASTFVETLAVIGLSNASFDFDFVDSLPVSQTGKFRYFISSVI
ncbi:hypothetical protein ACIPWF_22825 [Paenarthrobacter sp. NPDC089989]|uniref:hypothetical protein n=1 Tax=unclassified Paenarthrobacter TaxID=2634190 RepID=UPI00381FB67F